jgi:hypothetical protein
LETKPAGCLETQMLVEVVRPRRSSMLARIAGRGREVTIRRRPVAVKESVQVDLARLLLRLKVNHNAEGLEGTEHEAEVRRLLARLQV